MCGIGGVTGFDRQRIDGVKSALLEIQSHRGPDASASWDHKNTVLFHNRLSIIDLSSLANQPFSSSCGKFTMVFNGEIYNYQELRSDLLKRNIPLRTTSDTEVVLESFIHLGEDFVNRLNGMFAFAIYSHETEEIHIYRDRSGIKPLFYFAQGNRLAFASELKFLKKLVADELTINYNALGKYLHFGYVPAPGTVYNQVKQLEPGHKLCFRNGQYKLHQYWSIRNNISSHVQGLTANEIELELEKILIQSVKNHLVSDVPVGIFLSGGIDSSLLTALAVKASPNKLSTFSIGTTDSQFNETVYAKKVADYLGTTHNQLIVSPEESIKLVSTALNVYDQPFADSSSIPTLLVSQMASQQVKVCLSGEGADELFGGYGSYRWSSRLQNPFVFRSRKWLSAALRFSGSERARKAIQMLAINKNTFLPSHIFSCEQNLFSAREIPQLLGFDMWLDDEINSFKEISSQRTLTPLEQQSFYDIAHYLPDDLLAKVDRASMFHSLEVRVPYLDHELVRFSLNSPSAFKIRGGEHKYILKRILYKHLPKEFFNRPKQGFSVPVASWLLNELSSLIDENLNEDVIRRHEVIQNPAKVKSLVNRFRAGEGHLYNRIWSLIVLHKWFESSGIKK